MTDIGDKKPDTLARAYLAILAADENGPSRTLSQLLPGDSIDLMLGPSTPRDSPPTVRADHALAAVLVARAIESVDDLTRKLRRESPVVTIEVPSVELVHLVADVMEKCAFGPQANVMKPSEFFEQSRAVLLVAREGTDKRDSPEHGNGMVAKAVHVEAPIVGIATSPALHLPRDLVRISEWNLVLPRVDRSALNVAIEAVAGAPPTAKIDDATIGACDLADVALSIRRALSPNGCVEALNKLVSDKHSYSTTGPVLQELWGFGAAKRWGLQLAAELNEYRAGRITWSQVGSKAVLWVGPPGVGKTALAHAVARTAKLPIVATSVAAWNQERYMSGSLKAMADSFSQAKRFAPLPALLFIDEIDGIGDRSTMKGDYKEIWVQLVNFLLTNISSIQDCPVVLIAASNRPEAIDPAIRRAGRLDRTIAIEKPSVEDLRMIFRFYLKDALPHADLLPVAIAGCGGTGADVESWTRRARARARRANRDMLVQDLLEEIRDGQPSLPLKLRRAVALHESGHLVVGLALRIFDPRSLTIADDGGQASAAVSIENIQTETDIENVMTMLMAGRAAEEEFLTAAGATGGAGGHSDSDLAKATRAASAIELKLGFGSLGPMYFDDRAAELMMCEKAVLAAVRSRLERCRDRARRLVVLNRDIVELVAGRLEELGHLDRREIDRLTNGVSFVLE